MKMIKSKDGRKAINPASYTLPEFCLRSGYTEAEAAALGVEFRAAYCQPGPAIAGSRRMAEQLRWEREMAVSRDDQEKATGAAWKH